MADHFFGSMVIAPVPLIGDSGSTRAIYSISVNPGQDPTQRTNTTANVLVGPIVDPSGQKILFSHTGNLMEVSVTSTPGDEVMIWDGSTGVTGFCYSPDGNTILFTISDNATRHNLYTITADGTDQSGNEVSILADVSSRQVCGAHYNFSGTKIVFDVLLSSTSIGIWVCNADGSSPSQLSTSVTAASQIQFDQPITSWMHNSSRLAWNNGPLSAPVWKTMLDDGSSVVTLATIASGDGRPTWHTWFQDDSFLGRRKSSDGSIHKLAAAGGDSVLITPTSAATGSTPRLFGGRVYWKSVDDIWSCLEDGSDERNETGASAVNFSLL